MAPLWDNIRTDEIRWMMKQFLPSGYLTKFAIENGDLVRGLSH